MRTFCKGTKVLGAVAVVTAMGATTLANGQVAVETGILAAGRGGFFTGVGAFWAVKMPASTATWPLASVVAPMAVTTATTLNTLVPLQYVRIKILLSSKCYWCS